MLTREQVLLRAMYQLMKKQEDSCYVLDIFSVDTVWDGATCDGYCLYEEVQQLLEEQGVDINFVGEIEE